MDTWKAIKTAMVRSDIKSINELAELSGIGVTLKQTRRADPDSFRKYEFMALDKVLHFTDEEMLCLIRG